MTKQIKLTQSMFALVDDEDFDSLNKFKWHAVVYKHVNYAVRTIPNPRGNTRQMKLFMHRFITNAPEGMEVHHINHDGLDNRRCNLMIVTPAQNQYSRRLQGGVSKYKGVCWVETRKRWVASITKDGKTKQLGRFLNEEDAARAYNRAALLYFGELALLNPV